MGVVFCIFGTGLTTRPCVFRGVVVEVLGRLNPGANSVYFGLNGFWEFIGTLKVFGEVFVTSDLPTQRDPPSSIGQ